MLAVTHCSVANAAMAVQQAAISRRVSRSIRRWRNVGRFSFSNIEKVTMQAW
ncbi:MAG: hypothetical protein ACLTO3_02060 [Bifidobacterium bifidum]